MKYLHMFNNADEYNSQKNNLEAPYVAYLVQENNVSLKGTGTSTTPEQGGSVNVITSWEDYNPETMGNNALSAQLGYELHTELEGVDSLLDEINGENIRMINEINGEII